MNIDSSSAVFATALDLPKIDESNTTENRHPKERLLELLDKLEIRVENLRKEAGKLEEERDQLLAILDSVRHADLVNQLEDNDADDIGRYADRITNRCQTVEVCVLTQRDQLQEEALYQVNHLIDSLVRDLQQDHEVAKQRCVSYVNACSSMMIDGVMDKRFESTLLGCTLDDQKRVKRRLQGLLTYFDKLVVQSFD